MNREELLRRAAIAIGLAYKGSYNGHHIVYDPIVETEYEWDPIDNDKDAFRLATILSLLVDFQNAKAISAERKALGHNDWWYGDEDLEPDDDAAIRMAIVIAAANTSIPDESTYP